MNDVDIEEQADEILLDMEIWMDSAGLLSTLQVSLAFALFRVGFWLVPTSLTDLVMTSVDGALEDLDVDEF